MKILEDEADIEMYLDGLIQNTVIDNPKKDSYKVNQQFYDEAIKRFGAVQKKHPTMSKFAHFNMCMLLELMHRFNLASETEIDNYAQILVRCFVASGTYKKLFPDDWEREMNGQ